MLTELGIGPDLRCAALTHRSASSNNNERLEFLGDAVLNACIADLLYGRFPKAREGELTRARANLVCEASLAQIAHRLELSKHIRVGPGELKSGGYRRDSILADALEALIGALYLESGWLACREWIEQLFGESLQNPSLMKSRKDAKTELQEKLQGENRALPDYVLVASDGEDHDKQFTVECRLAEPALVTRARAGSRKKAEMQAAELALQQLNQL